jgi:hypothetical protein
MNGGELFLGGMAAFALLAITVKARGGSAAGPRSGRHRPSRDQCGVADRAGADDRAGDRRRAAAADHPPVQPDTALGRTRDPALLASSTLTKALTVTEIRPSSRDRSHRR